MKREYTHFAPPGTDIRRTVQVFLIALAAAVLLSGSFLTRYRRAYNALFHWIGQDKVLVPDALMQDFNILLGNCFWAFPLLMLCLLALVVWNYLSYRQGSMSIYLMRRLPDRSLLHHQCWTLPLLGMAICILVCLGLLYIYHLIYLNCTPVQCLPASYGRGF